MYIYVYIYIYSIYVVSIMLYEIPSKSSLYIHCTQEK